MRTAQSLGGSAILGAAAAVSFALFLPPNRPVTVQQIIPGFPSALTTMTMPQLRNNRWQLFAHLTTASNGQPLATPMWETWSTKCDLDLSPYCDSVKAAAAHTAFVGNSPQIDTPDPTKTTEPQRFSVVYYSPAAANFIKNQGLNNAAQLQQYLLNDLTASPSALPILPNSFPEDSIIVKEIWEGFSATTAMAANEKVFVYDPADPNFQQDYVRDSTALKSVTDWPFVKIKNNNGVADESSHATCQPSYSPYSTVPINCFFHKHYRAPCQPDMMLPLPLLASPGAPATACDVVLVGVQIMTKEDVSNWAWTTLWWTNEPEKITSLSVNDAPVHLLPPQYSHYMMQTSLGPAGVHPDSPLYSPYLEGPRSNGTQIDCVACHATARYDPVKAVPAGKPYQGHDTGQSLDGDGQELGNVTPCILVTLPNQAPCKLYAGFVWSLATSQDATTSQPLMLSIHNGP